MKAQNKHTPKNQGDIWRKRVMAAIGGWLERCKIEQNATKIKAIACRAAGKKNFNEIPLSRLRNLYNEFRNKSTDAESVKMVKSEEIGTLQNLN